MNRDIDGVECGVCVCVCSDIDGIECDIYGFLMNIDIDGTEFDVYGFLMLKNSAINIKAYK